MKNFFQRLWNRLFGIAPVTKPAVKPVEPPKVVEPVKPQPTEPKRVYLDRYNKLLINYEGLELVKHFESCFLESYLDPVNVWTIGWGRIVNSDGSKVRGGQRCTRAQADQWLLDDLYGEGAKYIRSMTLHEDGLNDNQFSALVSFTYNRGCGRYDQKLDDLVDAGLSDNVMDAAESKRITDCMLTYNWAGGGYLLGLDRRRWAEKMLFEGKDWRQFDTVAKFQKFKNAGYKA